MWLDSKAVNCPQKWGNFRRVKYDVLVDEGEFDFDCHGEGLFRGQHGYG